MTQMSEMQIADMDLSHLDVVYGIETRSFAVPWSKNELRKEIADNKFAIYKVALLDGVVVGYAGLWHIVNEGQITNIAVDIPYRKMGIGGMLVETLISCAIRLEMIGLTLEVRVSNKAAIALYERYGFKPEGLRKNYYARDGDGIREDAVIMWKYLNNNY